MRQATGLGDNLIGVIMEKWHFDRAIKLYVESPGVVLCSFRISEVCNITKTFTIEEFQYIVDRWVIGVNAFRTEQAGKVYWQYRDCGPRPECEPMEFVAVTLQGMNFRLSVDDMKDAIEQFEDQMYRYNNDLPPVD